MIGLTDALPIGSLFESSSNFDFVCKEVENVVETGSVIFENLVILSRTLICSVSLFPLITSSSRDAGLFSNDGERGQQVEEDEEVEVVVEVEVEEDEEEVEEVEVEVEEEEEEGEEEEEEGNKQDDDGGI